MHLETIEIDCEARCILVFGMVVSLFSNHLEKVVEEDFLIVGLFPSILLVFVFLEEVSQQQECVVEIGTTALVWVGLHLPIEEVFFVVPYLKESILHLQY